MGWSGSGDAKHNNPTFTEAKTKMKKSIEQFIKEKNERIDKLIEKKEKSIAYFNSVNAAVALLGSKATKKKIIEWRDFFYTEWRRWYLDNIIPQPKPLTETQIEYGKRTFQEKYNERSQLDDIETDVIEGKLLTIQAD